MLLYWKPIANSIKKSLKEELANYDLKNKYIWIFLLSDDKPSETYVNLKKQFWKDLGLDAKIFSKDNGNIDDMNFKDVISKISDCNNDSNCLWIIVQLPLNDYLKKYQPDILSSISKKKDIDWLWWQLFGDNLVGVFDFVPATPMAVLELLKYYELDNYKWKNVVIIWQSNLLWKPLALELMKRNAEIISLNEFVDKDFMKKCCLSCDIIISAAGKAHLINWNFVRDDNSQVLIDVGFSKANGKVYGDIDLKSVENKVKAVTPTPGGVWPTTIACLFKNIQKLLHIFGGK